MNEHDDKSIVVGSEASYTQANCTLVSVSTSVLVATLLAESKKVEGGMPRKFLASHKNAGCRDH